MNCKKLFLLLFFIQIVVLINAQSLLTDTTSIKYLPAQSEPISDWKNLNFNDDAWLETTGWPIIGYDDYTEVRIDAVQTLYTRSYFNIDTITNFDELVLLCDFDDGFVAYINGVECARVNMGKYGSETTFEQLSDRSHEMRIIQPYPNIVWGYYIDKGFIEKNIKVGVNVLSVEVHNDSIDGSDLNSLSILFDITDTPYNIFGTLSRFKKCVELDSTKLPIIVIESDEYGIPSKRIEVEAKIGIINNGEGNYNSPNDVFNEHSGRIKIEMRGESSATFPKQSFDFELRDEEGNDTSISLLGLPREADWILQGPFADKSQIRNAISYELARKTGHWAPRVKFCEVIINGEYVGLYNLIEKIKRDSNRVNIAKLREEENSGTDLTGGYILKYDKPSSKLEIVYPKEKNLQEEQKTYIIDFMDEYKSVLYSNDGLDNDVGYKKYIDEQSLIDYVIIAELGKNCDSYLFSSYLYKDKDDRDGRVKYGPIWDFDLCFGNSIWQEGDSTKGWQFEYRSNKYFEIKRLFEDPELVDVFQERWFELRKSFLHTDSLFARIDELRSELEDPIKRNYEVWPIIDKGLFFPAYYVYSYDEEIAYIKDWITARVAWMDNNINDIFYEVTDFTDVEDVLAYEASKFSANLYPNPMVKEFYVDLNMPKAGNLEIEIINIQGKVVSVIESTFVEKGNYKVYYNKGSEDLQPGLHIVSFKIDGKTYEHLKMLCVE